MAYSPTSTSVGSGARLPLPSGTSHGCPATAVALAWAMRSGNVIAIFESGSVAHVKENAVALSLRSNNDRKISDDWTGWAASSFSISWGVSGTRWLQTMAADPLVPNNHREVVLIPQGPPYSFGALLARLQYQSRTIRNGWSQKLRQSAQGVVAAGIVVVVGTVVTIVGVVVVTAPVGFGVWKRIRLVWIEFATPTILFPSPAALLGTLMTALRNVVNFVMSTDCALATKMTSLLCIWSLVARK
jgi:hypothetical protein